jgi:hypothetical protein
METRGKFDPEATHFLNVDLDVYSRESLEPLAATLGKKMGVHYVGREGREHGAHFSLPSHGQSAEALTRALCLQVERLPPAARRSWDRARRRDFNVGVQAGRKPYGHEIRLTEQTLARIARLRGSLILTTYAAGESGVPKPGERRGRKK